MVDQIEFGILLAVLIAFVVIGCLATRAPKKTPERRAGEVRIERLVQVRRPLLFAPRWSTILQIARRKRCLIRSDWTRPLPQFIPPLHECAIVVPRVIGNPLAFGRRSKLRSNNR